MAFEIRKSDSLLAILSKRNGLSPIKHLYFWHSSTYYKFAHVHRNRDQMVFAHTLGGVIFQLGIWSNEENKSREERYWLMSVRFFNVSHFAKIYIPSKYKGHDEEHGKI